MDFPDRKRLRLKGYNYANKNFYYVTICTHNKLQLFGSAGELNDIGKIAENELLNIPSHFNCVQIDKYVVMPHHIHAIIIIKNGFEYSAEQTGTFPTLSAIIGLYKSGVSKQIHFILPDIQIWQTSFYDRIIRNEQIYRKIWQYIDDNPKKPLDDELPNNELFEINI